MVMSFFLTNVFTGLSIIADCIDFRKPEVVAFALAGHFDDELLAASFYVAHHKESVGDEYKTDVRAASNVANIKDHIRAQINHIFREADREEQMARDAAFARVRNELKNRNQPHAQGTVAEIAAKFGISKSEVRRRKADGTLDELFAKPLT
jgi:hypothetical protein